MPNIWKLEITDSSPTLLLLLPLPLPTHLYIDSEEPSGREEPCVPQLFLQTILEGTPGNPYEEELRCPDLPVAISQLHEHS